MANLKSSQKKAVNSAVIAGKTYFQRNVTIQHVQEQEYKYTMKGSGKEGTYNRLLVAYGDNDDESIFGNQKGLLLSPKEDTAYPILANTKPGTRGIIVFEADYSILDEGLNKDEETGKTRTTPYQKEVDIKVVKFTPEKEGN